MLDREILEEALRVEREDINKIMEIEKNSSKTCDVDIIEVPVLIKTRDGEICFKVVGDIMHTYNKLIREKRKGEE